MAPSTYRRLWRWHFWAAMLVVPFVLLQSATGVLYLWHEQWADWAHAGLRFVEPRDLHASLDVQVAAAQALHPQAQAVQVIVAQDRRRATQVIFGGGHHGTGEGLPFPVFVDPHDAQVLGTLSGWQWLPGWSRKIHGGWPLGNAGSWLLELGACWALVMILSGLYLWWAGRDVSPERPRGVLAALRPRTGQGMRVLLRDLHSGVALSFSAILLLFLLSALPWTHFWGNVVLKPVQQALGQPSPFADTLRARSTKPATAVMPMTLDEAVTRARALGLQGALEIRLDGDASAALALANRAPRSAQETRLAFDRGTRALVARTDWADYPPLPRAVAIGVDLHEGTHFGRVNRWLNTALATALLWISLTGLLSWWLRRPRGKLGAPPRSRAELPRGVRVIGGLLCVVLPLLGLSVLLLWLLDALASRLRSPLQN